MVLSRIRRGGFQIPSPWGEPVEHEDLDVAMKHITGVAKMAEAYNCVIDYQILNEKFDVIAQG